jgi:hypothetical protein
MKIQTPKAISPQARFGLIRVYSPPDEHLGYDSCGAQDWLVPFTFHINYINLLLPPDWLAILQVAASLQSSLFSESRRTIVF